MRHTMTNPAQLMLFGNPSKKATKAKRAARPSTRKTTRSAKQKAAFAKMIAARKRSLGVPVMAKSTKRRGKKRGRRSVAAKLAKRTRRAARRHAPIRAVKRRARRSRRKSRKAAVTIVKVNPPKRHRRARHARRAKHRKVRRNPGSMSIPSGSVGLLGGLRHAIDNVQSTMKDGIKGYALLAAGAGGAVFAGTMVQSATVPLMNRFAPGLMANSLFARVFAAANFYLTGWGATLLFKNAKVKRGILAGATVAAVVELIKPGLIRNTASRLPIVGGIFGPTLAGLESDLGAIVESNLSGLGRSARSDLESLDDATVGMGALIGNDGMAGLGAVIGNDALAGLGCDVDTQSELVTSGDPMDGMGGSLGW